MRSDNSKEWLSLREAGKITGKTPAAIRTWINRRTQKNESVRVKKEEKKGRHKWLIHRYELAYLSEPEQEDRTDVRSTELVRERSNFVTLEYYDNQRKNWENEKTELIRTYEQAVMMYRFKFEDADRKLKLLPAPAEGLIRIAGLKA